MPRTAGKAIFAFETSAMIYCDPERDLLHPQADNTEIIGTAIDQQRFLESVFCTVLPRQVLERIRFIVMYAEGFRLIRWGLPMTDAYLEHLTGLRGIIVIRQANTDSRSYLDWNQWVDAVVKDWPVKPKQRLIHKKQNDPGLVERELKKSLLWIESTFYAQHVSQAGPLN